MLDVWVRLARGALTLLRVPTATGRAVIGLAVAAWVGSALLPSSLTLVFM